MSYTIVHFESIIHVKSIDYDSIIEQFRYVSEKPLPFYYLLTICRYSLNAKIIKELYKCIDFAVTDNYFTCVIKENGTVLFYQNRPSLILLYEYSISESLFSHSCKQPVSNTAVIITRKSPQHADNQLNLQF